MYKYFTDLLVVMRIYKKCMCDKLTNNVEGLKPYHWLRHGSAVYAIEFTFNDLRVKPRESDRHTRTLMYPNYLKCQ